MRSNSVNSTYMHLSCHGYMHQEGPCYTITVVQYYNATVTMNASERIYCRKLCLGFPPNVVKTVQCPNPLNASANKHLLLSTSFGTPFLSFLGYRYTKLLLIYKTYSDMNFFIDGLLFVGLFNIKISDQWPNCDSLNLEQWVKTLIFLKKQKVSKIIYL